ncbi:hypothetical protein Vafri_22133 [Volvox africanus]|uniref:Uncharacterized protein n=1 Tax=Volvox africanus TaxID=51714 RepID=A0A8J4C0B2_9CHLO|nr:hypothetical protein Vafri_22133 [Volvox africanus]
MNTCGQCPAQCQASPIPSPCFMLLHLLNPVIQLHCHRTHVSSFSQLLSQGHPPPAAAVLSDGVMPVQSVQSVPPKSCISSMVSPSLTSPTSPLLGPSLGSC